MEQAKPAAPPTPGPQSFSAVLPSALTSLSERSGTRSNDESERREATKGTVQYRLREHQKLLETRAALQVPVRFEERARFGPLGAWLSSRARARGQRFAEAPGAGAAPLLMGRSGSGKTHLLYATARAISEANVQRLLAFRMEEEGKALREVDSGGLEAAHALNVAALGWPATVLHVTSGAEIAHALRESVGSGTLEKTVDFYRQQDAVSARWTGVLVVDDVEVARMSDFLQVELYRIFDYRYQESLPTLVATNLAPAELARQLGDRIARRIVDMTEPFEL